MRKAIRHQRGYLKRDIGIIDQITENPPDYPTYLPKWLQDRLPVIRLLYTQQQEMFSTNTHRANNSIFSLSLPWVRPIVRGKQNADVEFGAKVVMSDVNGCLRVEELRWDAFNESTTFRILLRTTERRMVITRKESWQTQSSAQEKTCSTA